MHIPVLLNESIDGLAIKEGDVYVDGTLGSGGHASEVVKRFGKKVKIVGFDRDEDALDRAGSKLKALDADCVLVHGSFHTITTALPDLGIASADRILLDLGISSNQLEESGRGFTFLKDEPLLMTMKRDVTEDDTTAYDIVNDWEEENMIAIFKGYGEEKFGTRIARGIIAARKNGPIKTTGELTEIIKVAVPAFYRKGKTHPATKTFQAIRIAVNNELGVLEEGLANCFEMLSPKGRLAVITFHSLEDRIVKNFFKEKSVEKKAILIHKKPVAPSEDEVRDNPRSRSAKVRIIEKL